MRNCLSVANIGLVLGGGGLIGQAYHAGALAALEHDVGWDARGADVIVGTSAGAVTGALLRCEATAFDLAAWCVDAPTSPTVADLAARIDPHPRFDPFDWRQFIGPRHRSLSGVLAWMRSPWPAPVNALVSLLVGEGTISLDRYLRFFDCVANGVWPDRPLWITATRQADGRRAVFGKQGEPQARLSTAVTASCAIPGYFKPVRVHDRSYVDGGIGSTTNADLLLDAGVDIALVIAPMSAVPRPGLSPQQVGLNILRGMAYLGAHRECRRLQRAGIRTLLLEPSQPVVEAMGNDLMHHEVTDVVQHAFFDAGRQLHAADPAIKDALTRRSPIARSA